MRPDLPFRLHAPPSRAAPHTTTWERRYADLRPERPSPSTNLPETFVLPSEERCCMQCQRDKTHIQTFRPASPGDCPGVKTQYQRMRQQPGCWGTLTATVTRGLALWWCFLSAYTGLQRQRGIPETPKSPPGVQNRRSPFLLACRVAQATIKTFRGDRTPGKAPIAETHRPGRADTIQQLRREVEQHLTRVPRHFVQHLRGFKARATHRGEDPCSTTV